MKRKVCMVIFISIMVLCGCREGKEGIETARVEQKADKQTDVSKQILNTLSASEVEKIECVRYTGGKNGSSEYVMTKNEIIGFVDLLNQVELGDLVADENKTLSSGAVTYYTIQLIDGEMLKISPGTYFMIADAYYIFENFNDLWSSFVKFNSLG